MMEGRDEPVAVGKKNAINNFCIGIQGNWASCTSCHAGYGWEDENFDFENTDNVDCLVCHDNSGTYRKGKAGIPAEGVDLLAAAQERRPADPRKLRRLPFPRRWRRRCQARRPRRKPVLPRRGTRRSHGALQISSASIATGPSDHVIGGRAITVSVDNANQIACTDCHSDKLHADARINAHTDTVACQTCHIPRVAIKQATKMHWDWSEAGDSEPRGRYARIPEDQGQLRLRKEPQARISLVQRTGGSLPAGRPARTTTASPPSIRRSATSGIRTRASGRSRSTRRISPTTPRTTTCCSRSPRARAVSGLISTGTRPCAWGRKSPACRTAATTHSPKPRCTGRRPTWWRRRPAPCSARPAIARTAASTGRPWVIRVTRFAGVVATASTR